VSDRMHASSIVADTVDTFKRPGARVGICDRG
jgi:hypothetical protein